MELEVSWDQKWATSKDNMNDTLFDTYQFTNIYI